MKQNTTWAETQTQNWIKRHFDSETTDISGAAADVASTINSQYSAQKDYMARVLLELLQNVDDAAAESLDPSNDSAEFILDNNRLIVLNQGKTFNEDSMRAICLGYISPKAQNNNNITTGSKGIGFRGILNWSQDISIYSGDFAVQFSKDQCLKQITPLKSNKIFESALKISPDLIDKFPILLLPGNTDYPKEWKNGKYKATYDTCIEIIIEKDCIPLVANAMKNFITKEYYSALFFHALKNVKFTIIQPDGTKKQATIHTNVYSINSYSPSIKTIEIYNNLTKEKLLEQSFYIFTNGSETIAVPKNWNSWEKKLYNLYCTFPANKEFCPFPVLMNSYDFDLPSNRETIQNNEKNANIITKLENLLLNTVVPYFAKPEFGTQSIEILTYQQAENTQFLKNIDIINNQIAQKAIIPTLSGEYRRLTDNLKTLEYIDVPSVITNTNKNIFVARETYALLNFSPKLQSKICKISDQDLFDLINKNSSNWTTKDRISVFFFWVNKIDSSHMLPKLIKEKNNDFFSFKTHEHEPIFFYSGKPIKEIPSWVPFKTVAPEDQYELFHQLKSHVSESELKKETLDRVLTHKYPIIFNYMDKTRVIKEINKNVKGIYERAVDLVKCVYHNYKNDEKTNIETETTWYIPSSNNTLLSPDKVFFAEDYKDCVEAKICRAANLQPIAAPETFNINEDEKESFCYTIGNFFGIRSNITPIKKEIPINKFLPGYRELIKSKLINERVHSIISIESETIPELENILSNADQTIILEWLNKLPLNNKSNITINFYKTYYRNIFSITITLLDYIIYQLKHIPWLNINGEKVAPINCLIEQTRTKYPSELINYIPDNKKYTNLWKLLEINDNICLLPQATFYNFLLQLPKFDTNGEISKQIYRYIAKTPTESLPNLINNSNCIEKNNFFTNGKVWVKDRRNKKAGFVSISENVYFSSQKVLNIENKPIIDTPLRTGSIKTFAHIFGVKEFIENIQASIEETTKHGQNKEFHFIFEQFKPYLLALGATKKLDDTLPNLDITIAQSIKILNNPDNLNIEFNDYEVVPTPNANKYFVYLEKNKAIETNKIARAIGDICNTISSSSDIRDTVAYLYTSDNETRKQILQDNGCNIDLLSEYQNIKQLFIDTIKKIRPTEDVNKILSETDINFDNFESESNTTHILKILNKLNSNVAEFEQNGFPYINLVPHNKKLLANYIYSNKDKFQTWLYNELLGKSIEEQAKFQRKIKEYDLFAETYHIPNTHNFDPLTVKPIPDITGLVNYTVDIYKKNLEELKKTCTNTTIMEEILNIDSNVSLLTFGHINYIKDQYDTAVTQKDSKNNITTINLSQTEKTLKIHVHKQLPTTIMPPIQQHNNQSQNYKRIQHTSQCDIQKQKAGLRAESQVYKTLKNETPNTIEWISGNAVLAGVIPQGQADDTTGYDMCYLDKNGNKKYAEVKNATHIKDNIYSFIISPNEEQFALSHTDTYSIFLVISDDHIEQISGEVLKQYLKNAQPESKKCIISISNTTL